jgi:hypothetical protein
MACISYPLWKRECEKYHLTIKDIKEMKTGDLVRLFFFDRNMCDHVVRAKYKTRTKRKVMVDVLIESSYTAVFEKEDDLQGNFIWFFHGHSRGKPVHTYREDESRWFEIEYAPDCWFPLNEDGVLEFGPDDFDYPEDYDDENEPPLLRDTYSHLQGKRWYEFDENTRVGWRGPCMKLNDLKKVPQVFSC